MLTKILNPFITVIKKQIFILSGYFDFLFFIENFNEIQLLWDFLGFLFLAKEKHFS